MAQYGDLITEEEADMKTETRPAQRRDRDEVRCLCGIKGHSTYWKRKDNSAWNERIHTISEPYQKPDGSWWIKVESEYEFEQERSLADMGVVRYVTGGWNQSHYLVLDEKEHFCPGYTCPRCGPSKRTVCEDGIKEYDHDINRVEKVIKESKELLADIKKLKKELKVELKKFK